MREFFKAACARESERHLETVGAEERTVIANAVSRIQDALVMTSTSDSFRLRRGKSSSAKPGHHHGGGSPLTGEEKYGILASNKLPM